MTWEKAAVDLDRNTIRVSPGKTQNYDNPIHLEIVMGEALRTVVKECLASPVVCPFLHYQAGHEEKGVQYQRVGADLKL